MTFNSYLSRRGQISAPPTWLQSFDASSRFNRDEFFQSRVVFYPGCGTDGHAVEVFGGAHAAYAFVMADYAAWQETSVQSELAPDHPHRFRGYRVAWEQQLQVEDLLSSEWTPHVRPSEVENSDKFASRSAAFGRFVVLEREPDFGVQHGAERLAIVFLGADGIATYDALFCQGVGDVQAPYAVLLQDHGFGGNYNRFGGGGLMETIAARTRTWPEWLLVGENTSAWGGYRRVRSIAPSAGGVHRQRRSFWRRTVVGE